MNPAAKIYRTENARIDLEKILNQGGFNLDRALEVDPKFLEPEYPFEWGGVFQFAAGRHDIVLQDGPDPMMNLAVLPVQGASYEHLEEVQMEAVLTYSDEEHPVPPGGTIVPGKQLHQLICPTERNGSRWTSRRAAGMPYSRSIILMSSR